MAVTTTQTLPESGICSYCKIREYICCGCTRAHCLKCFMDNPEVIKAHIEEFNAWKKADLNLNLTRES